MNVKVPRRMPPVTSPLFIIVVLTCCSPADNSSMSDDQEGGVDTGFETNVDSETDTETDQWFGLEWQNPPSEEEYEWMEAIEYCEELVLDGDEDWRLPSVGEYRAFFTGCPNAELNGECDLWDDCLSWFCADDCVGCETDQGPTGGCYWANTITGTCENYWTESGVWGEVGRAWYAILRNASFGHTVASDIVAVRCVRGELIL